MGANEVQAYLTQLAVRRNVAPSTQNQALSALLFLYRKVLKIDLPWMNDVHRAKTRRKDRLTFLPGPQLEPLRLHIDKVHSMHEQDLNNSYGTVYRCVDGFCADSRYSQIIAANGKNIALTFHRRPRSGSTTTTSKTHLFFQTVFI